MRNIFTKDVLKKNFLKSILITFIFGLSHYFYNIEYVANKVEDPAFDIFNEAVLSQEIKMNYPNIITFGFDDTYFKKYNLVNENNETTYGYMFPRDHIADFINKIDKKCMELDAVNIAKPKALFIDFDLSYTTLPYGKKLSKQDQQLLDVLSKGRPYKIILLRNNEKNFVIENSTPRLDSLISKQQIIFVSSKLLGVKNGEARRYRSYTRYGNEKYLNINLYLWQLLKSNDVNVSRTIKEVKDNDLIANRILFKKYNKIIRTNGEIYYQSSWLNHQKYSVDYNLSSIVSEDFKNSILMLGGTYSSNPDKVKVLQEKYFGVDVLANATLTSLYFNGQIGRFNIIYASIAVFLLFLITLLITEWLHNLKFNNWVLLLVTFAIMFCIICYINIESLYLLFFTFLIFEIVYFFLQANILDEEYIKNVLASYILALFLSLLSYYLMQEEKIWFNWLTTILIFRGLILFKNNFVYKKICEIKR